MKIIKVAAVILSVVIVLALSMGFVDYIRVYQGNFPLFTIPVTADDGGSGSYYGLGYSIDIEGNFMPEDPLPGIKHVNYFVFGFLLEEIYFE